MTLSDATGGAAFVEGEGRGARSSISCVVRVVPDPKRTRMVERLAAEWESDAPPPSSGRGGREEEAWGQQLRAWREICGEGCSLWCLLVAPWRLASLMVRA